MRLKIGTVELENNVILGPMAGVTDLPFRLLCREQGAGLVCMEMVSAFAGKSRGAARFPSAVWLGSGGPFGYRRQTGGGALRSF